MAIRVALNHKTTYRYDRPVTLLPQVVRLRPAPHCRTPVLAYSLKVTPKDHFLNWQQDPYSNHLARLVFPKPVQEFNVEVDLVAEMTTINPFDFFVQADAEEYPFRYDEVLAKELAPYLETPAAGPKLEALVDQFREEKVRTIDFIVGVNQAVQEAVGYVVRLEPGIQPSEETLTLGTGSCRDSAWLLVQLFRHLGVAARFSSGYLIQLTADVKSLDGPSGPEADFTDLHAWAEVYLPGAGWVGLDPTSGLLCGEGHLPLACAADPLTAAPISGSFDFEVDPSRGEDDQVETEFDFAMSVRRIHEDPRVTKPYSDDQWAMIEALGRQVDESLKANDVRLTMGGEPTFVSIDDRDGAEWNLAALGPGKRKRAGELFRRLRDRWAPHGLLHFGQGKWYPGEQLPRWAMGCYWRKDGVPVWKNPGLVAEDDHDYGLTADDARRFAEELAGRLGVDPGLLVPGYEDAWYHMWRERMLPANVDPLKSNLEDKQERDRLARVFERGLNKAVGFALPLRPKGRDGDRTRWESGRWFFRRENMYLFPGDSPMGLRMPLDSLPWEAPEVRQSFAEPDPSIPRGALPPRADYALRAQIPGVSRENNGPRSGLSRGPAAARPEMAEPPVVRTSLCVEPRDGRLFVFMPPLTAAEDYLDLTAAVEATAERLGMPVQVEGYTPPNDLRLPHFKITPDPGVIEVNVHPAANWADLVKTTTTLYDEAHLTRLGTEKFMLDGRHTGTGGGNHIVVGGQTVLDSPFLRRPDLLRSLINYWHNHPSLSYLFSGMFVGPTSQAPRMDEARNDSVHEMEVAFEQIPERGPCPPWLVDRTFRNLLVDVSGNTHRAEFCIDKLFTPEGGSGRLGLVELRAFEMPPHARMSLAQQLLLRALIAAFWEKPYRQTLVRWGTELHDRFMLPHYVKDDFGDVVADLRQAGFPVRPEWFAPHLEFRFPFIGSVVKRGVGVELRHAIEPWHVLGEETSSSGTSRYVDSSVERVQVKVTGLTDSRHAVTCNGRKVPLRPTGTIGEFVAGVRYRAWQPESCLHPNIPVHAPLVFDLLDGWNGRSLGGCTYHVAHPGGLSHEKFPVNAYEAEGRRIARFTTVGHTPGKMPPPPDESSPEHPFTLDLRRAFDPPPAPPTPVVPSNGRQNGTWFADAPKPQDTVAR